jgi:tetratricopeptide (TPR) repeat protein
MKSLIGKRTALYTGAYTYYVSGIQYASEGKFIKAEEQFKIALEIDKSDYLSKSALETLNDFNMGIIKKKYILSFFRGLDYAQNLEYQQAIKEFINAIKINPNYARAYNCLGNVHNSLNNPREAITYFEKAIQINPNYARAYNNLAGVYFSLGEYRQAIAYSEKAIRINPDDAQNYYNLGLAFHRLDESVQARENFQKAKELFRRQGDYKNMEQAEKSIQGLL